MLRKRFLLVAVLIFFLLLPSASEAAELIRQDYVVEGEAGIRLFVREVRQTSSRSGRSVLLIHGARVPGIGSFDLPVAGGSLAGDLAEQGFVVYVMDVRGYGRSTRPAAMSEPPDRNRPLVRSTEVIRDIDAVVNWIAKRTGGRKVALLGWATGGHWAGHYATLHSDKLTHLILYNMLYGGSAAHPAIGRGSDLEDPQQPGRFNFAVIGAYRLSVASSLLAGWDRSIPVEEKSQWRSSEVADAYIKAALESDPTSHTRTPPSFRAPSGALEDSFYQATGRQLWDAAFIRAQTLVIAAERDFWSRPEDRKLLEQHLVHARKVRVVVVPNATHFMHLDRPERGRSQFLREVINFLSAE